MKIAAIRIRGLVRISPDSRKVLELLKLHKKFFCVIYEDSPSIRGMLNKAKDYITYGEISDETYKMLIDKKGELIKRENCSKGIITYTCIEYDGKKYKPFFRLNSPKGGFERGGIKVPIGKGGALGYRKDKINELIVRMT